MQKRHKAIWWHEPAGPGLRYIVICVSLAALALVMAGCSVDTTRPDYTVRLFESPEEIQRKHELRRQDWRQRQQRRRDLEFHRWHTKHY